MKTVLYVYLPDSCLSSEGCHGNRVSLHDDADVFLCVCMSIIIQDTVEVWPRAHILRQLLSLVNATYMFLD